MCMSKRLVGNIVTAADTELEQGLYPLGLPLTSLCDLPLLFVYFQVNNGVLYFLHYVEDIYIMGPLCSRFNVD